MKLFKIELELYGTYTYEDPKCPSYWRGSGCYDIIGEMTQEATAFVYAEREKEAIELLDRHDFCGSEIDHFEGFKVICVDVDCDDCDEEKGIDDIEYGHYESDY